MMLDIETKVVTIKDMKTTLITMDIKCMSINLINLILDKEETTEDIIEEVTMTSVSNQEIDKEEELVDNTTIIKVIQDINITTTTNTITSTTIDNNIDLANNNSCTMKEDKAP